MASDTIVAMRMAVAVIVVAAACSSDPTFHVTVTHPQGLAIATTTITVYESASLTCEDVALSRLTADQLGALATADETIASDGKITGALTGVSRTDHKVIVARGLDAMANLLAAGCAEHDVIDGDAEIAIATEVAVIVSVIPPDPTSNDPSAVEIGASDPAGKVVDNREVSWTIYGPAGATPLASTVTVIGDGTWQPNTPTCTTSGLVRVHPVPPSVIGGYAVQMRVAWATAQPALFTSLTAGDIQLKPFNPPAGSNRFCAIRMAGATHRLVCLENTTTTVTAHDYDVHVAGGAATLSDQQQQVIAPDAIAIVAVASGSDRDVYAVTSRGRLIELFGAPAADNSGQPCPPAQPTCANPIDDAIALPPCGTLPGKLLLHTSATGAGQLLVMNARGGATANYPLPPAVIGETLAELDRAGCVTTFSANGGASQLRQVTSIHMGHRVLTEFLPANTFISYNCTGTTCATIAMAPGAGIGFTSGSEPRMLATSVDATGVVVLQVVMATDTSNRDHFIERARVAAASLPEHVVVGQFDTDSTTDMLWSITPRRSSTAAFEIAYARLVNDQPLEALSRAQPLVVDDILSGDLTGDGHDDIVITGQTTGGSGLLVIPMDVATAAAVPPADPTCKP